MSLFLFTWHLVDPFSLHPILCNGWRVEAESEGHCSSTWTEPAVPLCQGGTAAVLVSAAAQRQRQETPFVTVAVGSTSRCRAQES